MALHQAMFFNKMKKRKAAAEASRSGLKKSTSFYNSTEKEDHGLENPWGNPEDADANFIKKVGIALGFVMIILLYLMLAVGVLTNIEVEEGVEWSPLDAFWFAIVTITSVGYGDFYPHTDGARIFTIFYVIFGFSVIGGTIMLLAELLTGDAVNQIEDIMLCDDCRCNGEQLMTMIGRVHNGHMPDKKELLEFMESMLETINPDCFHASVKVAPKTKSEEEDLEELQRAGENKCWRGFKDWVGAHKNGLNLLLFFSIGVIFFNRVEGFSVLEAIYFSVITLSTVGYGDISPSTDEGRVFAIMWILLGVAITAKVISDLNAYFNDKQTAMMYTAKEAHDAHVDIHGEDKAQFCLEHVDHSVVIDLNDCILMLLTLMGAGIFNNALFQTFAALWNVEDSILSGWIYLAIISIISVYIIVKVVVNVAWYDFYMELAREEMEYIAKHNNKLEEGDDINKRSFKRYKKVQLEYFVVSKIVSEFGAILSSYAVAIALNTTLEQNIRVILKRLGKTAGDTLEGQKVSIEEFAMKWGVALLTALLALCAQSCCMYIIEKTTFKFSKDRHKMPQTNRFRNQLRNEQSKIQVYSMALLAAWAVDAACKDTFAVIFSKRSAGAEGLIVRFVWAIMLFFLGVSFTIWICHLYPTMDEKTEDNEEMFDRRHFLLISCSYVVALAWSSTFEWMFAEFAGDVGAAAGLFLYGLIMFGLSWFVVNRLQSVVGKLKNCFKRWMQNEDKSQTETSHEAFEEFVIQILALITAMAFSGSMNMLFSALYDPNAANQANAKSGAVMSYWVSFIVTSGLSVVIVTVLARAEHQKNYTETVKKAIEDSKAAIDLDKAVDELVNLDESPEDADPPADDKGAAAGDNGDAVDSPGSTAAEVQETGGQNAGGDTAGERLRTLDANGAF